MSPRSRPQGVACAHCGLPVPADRIAECVGPSFCCAGCATVYEMINGAGLSRYYELKAADIDAEAVQAHPHLGSYAEFDDAEFGRLHARDQGGRKRIELYLEGVHCAACVWLVEKLPEVLPGVESVRLDFGRSVVSVEWNPGQVRLSQVAVALDRFGYPPHPYRSAERRALSRKEERGMLIKLALAGAVAGNTMLMAVALYAGAWQDPSISAFMRWLSLVITLPAVLWAGQTFFRGAWAGMRARTLHMDLPVSIAIATATGASIWNTIAGNGGVFFDSVTMLIFLLLAARWLQFRALRASSDASELLFSLAPSRARLVGDDGAVRDVPVETIVQGQVVEVLAGESIPADGVIVQGQSRVDNALLTGESLPVDVQLGDQVHAGGLNQQSRVLVRVSATGENTRVGKLLAAVQMAQQRRAPIVQLADRMAVAFVSAVLVLAALSGLLWWSHGPALVIERIVAMLVVTCPCALGLATPLAIAHALGAAARAGIYVKGADTIEALTRIQTVVFDKTGTLTAGKVALTSYDGPHELLRSVAALESSSSHPYAKAVQEAVPAGERGVADDVHDTAGGGLRGRVDGHDLAVGNEAYLRRLGVSMSGQWAGRVQQAARTKGSPVLVARDGDVVGLMTFGDPMRPEAAAAVAWLRGLGMRVGVLSGDHGGVVARVAQELGIGASDAQGDVTPEGKLERVEQLAASGEAVAMVGDGVNDAGALAAARVGIAVRGGAEVSLATADVFLTRSGLEPVVELFRGARSTMRVIHRGLAISVVYNLIGAGLALAGYVDPLAAAVLMPVSSLTVILSAMWSRPFPKRRGGGTSAGAPVAAREVVACP